MGAMTALLPGHRRAELQSSDVTRPAQPASTGTDRNPASPCAAQDVGGPRMPSP